MNSLHTDYLQKIFDLSKKRIDSFCDAENPNSWYRGSETYFEALPSEIAEAAAENQKNNHVFLEDELGDVFWNFCCLLRSLEREGKISEFDAVFRRSYDKFSERIIDSIAGKNNWEEIKNRQKTERKREHEASYGEDEEIV